MENVDAYKRQVLSEISSYTESAAVRGQILAMNDLGLRTVNSQYGRRIFGKRPLDPKLFAVCSEEAADDPADTQGFGPAAALYAARGGRFGRGKDVLLHTERAFVSGYMEPERARALWAELNKTDAAVCLVNDLGIPVTYRSYTMGPTLRRFYRHDEAVLSSYDASHGVLHPMSILSANSKVDMEGMEGMVSVSVFDPVHGRAARTGLFPTVIASLKKCG